MIIRTFEDLLSWVAPIIQKSSLRRSTATPAERLSCTDWIILSSLKHQKTTGHKIIFFFFIGVLIVRPAAKFLLLLSSCYCCWWLNFLLPQRKLLLTSIRLTKLSLKKEISFHIVRKSSINFKWRLFVGSHVEEKAVFHSAEKSEQIDHSAKIFLSACAV